MLLNYDYSSDNRGCSVSVWDETVTVSDVYNGSHMKYSFAVEKSRLQSYIRSVDSLYWTRKFIEIYQVIYEEPFPVSVFNSFDKTPQLVEFIYLMDGIPTELLLLLRNQFDTDRTPPILEDNQNLIAVVGRIGSGKTVTMQRELIRQNICETSESVIVCTPITDTYQFGGVTKQTIEYDEITARKEVQNEGVSVLETASGNIDLEILSSVIMDADYSGWVVLDTVNYDESELEDFVTQMKRYNYGRESPVRIMMSFLDTSMLDMYTEFDCVLCHNLSSDSGKFDWAKKAESVDIPGTIQSSLTVDIDSKLSESKSPEVVVYDTDSKSSQVRDVQLTPLEYGLVHSSETAPSHASVGSPIPDNVIESQH